MNAEEFKDYCRVQFGFLLEEFGFQEEIVSGRFVNPFQVRFVSQTTQIIVEGINHGFGIDVLLGTREQYRGFTYADLLAIRNPNFEFVVAKPSDTSEIQKPQLEQGAKALREYATDVLNGDFSVFPLLAERVHQREIAYREQQRKAREEQAKGCPKDYSADDTLRELVKQGKTIEAIGRLREKTGMGLKEAKDYVESL